MWDVGLEVQDCRGSLRLCRGMSGLIDAELCDVIGEFNLEHMQATSIEKRPVLLPLSPGTTQSRPSQQQRDQKWCGKRPPQTRPNRSRFSRRARPGNGSATRATSTTQPRGSAQSSRGGPTTPDGACETITAGTHGNTWRMTTPPKRGRRHTPTSTSWVCHW